MQVPLPSSNWKWRRNTLSSVWKYRKSRILWIISAIFVIYYYLWLVGLFTERKIRPSREQEFNETRRRLKETIAREKGTGCVMPRLDLFSAEMRKFDKIVETVACNAKGEDWVQCQFAECFVRNETLAQMRDIQCVYNDVMYVNDDYTYLGESVTVLGDGKYSLRESNHVKVSCKGSRLGSASLLKSRWSGFLAGYRPVQPAAAPPATALNVLMLFFDSVSRLKFLRTMPISYKMLTKNLSAVVMDSYNIVGDGTTKNLIPVLSGFEDFELPILRRAPGNNKLVDPEPFVFTLLKRLGYRTAYYEDVPDIGPFQYRYNGFKRMPTDDYVRPLFQIAESYSLLRNLEIKQQLCFGSKPLLQFLLDYTVEMFNMNGKKFCLTFSNSYSHDHGGEWVRLIDEDFAEFLYKFKVAGHLEDTLLFVMSDHGARFAEVRETRQGKLEELLPFVSLVLPERLKRNRPEAATNLLANSKVLTTPFDIYATILDALDLKSYRVTYKVEGADLERGLSLLERIPATRSCAEAGILPNWCACTRWQDLSPGHPVYTQVASELANHVNRATSHLRDKCAKRHLISVNWVRSQITFDTDKDYYQANIVMDPGMAIYEGYVEHQRNENIFSIYDSDVARINKYGDEPHCIKKTEPSLNKYCYCLRQYI